MGGSLEECYRLLIKRNAHAAHAVAGSTVGEPSMLRTLLDLAGPKQLLRITRLSCSCIRGCQSVGHDCALPCLLQGEALAAMQEEVPAAHSMVQRQRPSERDRRPPRDSRPPLHSLQRADEENEDEISLTRAAKRLAFGAYGTC